MRDHVDQSILFYDHNSFGDNVGPLQFLAENADLDARLFCPGFKAEGNEQKLVDKLLEREWAVGLFHVDWNKTWPLLRKCATGRRVLVLVSSVQRDPLVAVGDNGALLLQCIKPLNDMTYRDLMSLVDTLVKPQIPSNSIQLHTAHCASDRS